MLRNCSKGYDDISMWRDRQPWRELLEKSVHDGAREAARFRERDKEILGGIGPFFVGILGHCHLLGGQVDDEERLLLFDFIGDRGLLEDAAYGGKDEGAVLAA